MPTGRPVSVAGSKYTNVAPSKLHAMLRCKTFNLVNVHIPFEGNVAQTDAFIPYNAIERNINLLPRDKQEQIVLYRPSGRMSAEAAQTLVNLGYSNIWILDGGMIAWAQEGYALA